MSDELARSLARLNHILIPASKDDRDKARRNPLIKLVAPITWTYSALSDPGRNLLVLLFLLGGISIDLSSSQGYWLWAMGTALLLASLILRPLYRLRHIDIELSAPRQVVLGESVELCLQLHNRGQRDYDVINVDRPMLPWDGSWQGDPIALPALPAQSRRSVTTKARFIQRGHHHLDRFWVAGLVPGGLAQGRRLGSRGLHIIVVPKIAKLARLQLSESSRYQQGGVAMASNTGESMELMGVRPYRQGDSVRDLHARGWARHGKPVVREYHQEFFSRVGVVLDTDLAGARPRRLEAAISLTAGVIAKLSRGDALIDVLVTGNHLHSLTVGRSLGFLDQALDHLACVRAGKRLQAQTTAQLLAPYLDRLSCVVLIVLHWDEPRQQLAHRLRQQGVGLRILQLCDGAPDVGEQDLNVPSRVSCRAIENGAELLL